MQEGDRSQTNTNAMAWMFRISVRLRGTGLGAWHSCRTLSSPPHLMPCCLSRGSRKRQPQNSVHTPVNAVQPVQLGLQVGQQDLHGNAARRCIADLQEQRT